MELILASIDKWKDNEGVPLMHNETLCRCMERLSQLAGQDRIYHVKCSNLEEKKKFWMI